MAGHRIGDNAPLPNGTAYCLIGRYGSDTNSAWFEVKNFYEADVPEKQRGTLQLNTNDDNPYNGDPNKRWNVRVSVRRTDAASAGIFI